METEKTQASNWYSHVENEIRERRFHWWVGDFLTYCIELILLIKIICKWENTCFL